MYIYIGLELCIFFFYPGWTVGWLYDTSGTVGKYDDCSKFGVVGVVLSYIAIFGPATISVRC